MAKVAQQVLLSLPEKEDVLALAIVRQESQAEVVRAALTGSGLAALLAANARELNELFSVLDGMKVERYDALKEMAEVKKRADGRRRYMLTDDLKTAEGTWRKSFPWPKA